jgi:uncharacterized protein (TIGR02285 family)
MRNSSIWALALAKVAVALHIFMRGHMKKYVYMIFVIFFALLLCSDRSEATGDPKKIIWMKSHYPPYYITEGPNVGKGIADNVEKLLQKELVGYQHDSAIANWRRVLKEIKAGNNVVSLTLLKTADRQKFIEYSILTSLTPANGICVRVDDVRFGDTTNISLRKLLENKNIRIGIMHGRAYGKGIDDLIKEYQGSANIHIRTSGDGAEGLVLLLIKKRIDVVICYPYESTWVGRRHGVLGRIKQLRVQEVKPLNYSYSGAPKTDWGRKVIKDINDVYKKHNILQKTSTALEPYLDEDTVKWYREEIRKLMDKSASRNAQSK